jgi:hypothetical protein
MNELLRLSTVHRQPKTRDALAVILSDCGLGDDETLGLLHDAYAYFPPAEGAAAPLPRHQQQQQQQPRPLPPPPAQPMALPSLLPPDVRRWPARPTPLPLDPRLSGDDGSGGGRDH